MAAEINRNRETGCSSNAEAQELIQMRKLEAQKKRLAGVKAAGKRMEGRMMEGKLGKLDAGAMLKSKSATNAGDFASVVLEAQIANKRKSLRWRGPCEYRSRMCCAWITNFSIVFVSLLISITLGAKFGENATSAMCISWLMAYGWTFLLVEPFQILVLAGAPCLFNEDHRCGRCMVRCRFVYNELCAP